MQIASSKAFIPVFKYFWKAWLSAATDFAAVLSFHGQPAYVNISPWKQFQHFKRSLFHERQPKKRPPNEPTVIPTDCGMASRKNGAKTKRNASFSCPITKCKETIRWQLDIFDNAVFYSGFFCLSCTPFPFVCSLTVYAVCLFSLLKSTKLRKVLDFLEMKAKVWNRDVKDMIKNKF